MADMERPDFDKLLEKYHKGECTPQELDFIESWYLQYHKDAEPLSQAELEHEVAQMTESMGPRVSLETAQSSLIRRLRLPLGIAASILMVFSIGYLLLFNSAKEQEIAKQVAPISPGRQAASLTLANGKKIFLSDQQAGKVAQEAGVSISKTSNGELIYEIIGVKNQPQGFNTLATSNGETYRVKLPDGSMVWLNAASSLQYPVSFQNSKNREVQLSGEAYFEISKDRQHPFIVKSKGQQVEVLGTHFNVNAYKEEPNILTTLLEGSVRLTSTNNGMAKVLKPGQQAALSADQIQIQPIDTRSVTAWKDGYFRFKNESLPSIMRKISRWYNVEVVFEKGIPEDTYSGAVARHDDISQVLEIMEGSNNIHFTIKERRIIVSK